MATIRRWAVAVLAALTIGAAAAGSASAVPLGSSMNAVPAVQERAEVGSTLTKPQTVQYFYRRRYYRPYYRHFYRPYYRPHYRRFYRPYHYRHRYWHRRYFY